MNNLIRYLTILSLAAGFAAGTPSTTAAEPTSTLPSASTPGSTKTTRPRSDIIPIRGKISAVNLTSKTITLASKENPRTVYIPPDTRLTKDGKEVKLDAAAIGDEVGGRVRKTGDRTYEAVSLRFGPKPAAVTGTSPSAAKKAPSKDTASEEMDE